MFEDQVADEFRVKLDNDWGGGRFLGWKGEGVHQGGVDLGGVGGGDITTLFGSI